MARGGMCDGGNAWQGGIRDMQAPPPADTTATAYGQ